MSRQPLFRAAALGRARVLWHQVQQKLPCLGHEMFTAVFSDWERVLPKQICMASTLQKRVNANVDHFMWFEADSGTAGTFQEIRRLQAGRALMQWCSFDDFSAAWHGCVTSLDKKNVSDFKFVSEIIVVFQHNAKWVTPNKLHAYVSTAQWTGFKFNCAQSFAVDCPPFGFDEGAAVLAGPKKYFDCIVDMAQGTLLERYQAKQAKEVVREERQRARKQAQLDQASNNQ